MNIAYPHRLSLYHYCPENNCTDIKAPLGVLQYWDLLIQRKHSFGWIPRIFIIIMNRRIKNCRKADRVGWKTKRFLNHGKK